MTPKERAARDRAIRKLVESAPRPTPQVADELRALLPESTKATPPKRGQGDGVSG